MGVGALLPGPDHHRRDHDRGKGSGPDREPQAAGRKRSRPSAQSVQEGGALQRAPREASGGALVELGGELGARGRAQRLQRRD